MSKFDLREGTKFRELTLVRKLSGSNSHTIWLAKCSCGGFCTPRADALVAGNSTSCGCLRTARIKEHGKAKLKHGATANNRITPEYRAWRHMINRCTNPKVERYPYYGGRGIKVCDEWLHSFELFIAHVGSRPSPEHSIDRINTNGNYEPGNVRWATKTTQALNRTNARMLTLGNKTQSITLWAREFGINPSTLRTRLSKPGVSVEAALTTPVAAAKGGEA